MEYRYQNSRLQLLCWTNKESNRRLFRTTKRVSTTKCIQIQLDKHTKQLIVIQYTTMIQNKLSKFKTRSQNKKP